MLKLRLYKEDMVMTEKNFKLFLISSIKEFEAKQNKLFSDIGSYEEYWFDQVTKTLQFKNNGKVQASYSVICIGTWASQEENWMWCWANASFISEVRKEAECLKWLEDKTGVSIFREPFFECPENRVYELVAMSVNYLNAIGLYRVKGDENDLYIALMSKQ